MDKVKEQQTKGSESMEIVSTWQHSFHRRNQSKFQPFSTVFWRQYSRSIWRLFNCFLTSVLKVNLTTFQLIFNVNYSPFKVKNIRKKVLHFQLCFDHLLTPLCNVNLTTFWRICAHGVYIYIYTQCAHLVKLTSKSRHFLVGWSMTKFWLKINCLLIFKAEFSWGLKFLWDSLQFWLFLIFTIMQK